jgi:hypothetical protein
MQKEYLRGPGRVEKAAIVQPKKTAMGDEQQENLAT